MFKFLIGLLFTIVIVLLVVSKTSIIVLFLFTAIFGIYKLGDVILSLLE